MTTWTLLQRHQSYKRSRRRHRRAFRPAVELLETRLAPANVDVLSFHNDPAITGQNLQETLLTPANVNAASFGRLASQAVDGYVYAQPLYKANLAIPGKGTHNVVFVATQHDGVYAFDADNLTLLWQRSFIDPANGINTVPNGDVGSGDVVPELGITGAPVIDPTLTTNPLRTSDPASATIYFVAKTKETRGDGAHYVQRLHALDITTGVDKFVGTMNANSVTSGYTIGDTKGGDGYANQTSAIHVAGTGADSGGGDLKFSAFREAQRPSLQLLGGRVYVAWASHGDNGPYHGWVVGFNETTLQPEKWWNSSPNARGNGIWQSEGALSTDGTYIYFAIGNGFNGPKPAFSIADGNYSESVVKLDPTTAGTAINVKDYFTPNDWQNLDNADADLGSGGVMLLPDSVGGAGHTHLMVETGKSGKIYLIDRDNLGQFTQGGPDHVVQVVQAGPGGVWGNPSYYQESASSGLIYYHGQGTDTRVFKVSGGTISPASSVYNSGQTFGFPGADPTISANGQNNATAIDWELQVDNYGSQGNATLHAYMARPAASSGTLPEIYNSNQTGQRDHFGGSVKFTTAIVTNGHVYAGAEYSFSLFGLFPASTQAPQTPTNLMAAGVSDTQIRLTWSNPTPGPNNAPTGTKVLRSVGDNMHYTQVTTVARDATNFVDTGLDPSQVYFYKLVATNQTGDSAASAEAMGTPSVAPPVLQVANASAVNVILGWSRPQVANDHYSVERSTNNFMTFTTVASNLPGSQTTFTDPVAPGTYQYRIRAFTNASGTNFALSNVVQARVGPGSSLIDYHQANSFPQNPPDLQANADAQFAEGTARLTRATNQTGSVFSVNKENVLNWTTEFTVRLHEGTQPNYADGFTFVIQANSPSALGAGLGGLGYQGITNSVAIKFDTFQNNGETSANSTGLYTGGANPGGPANGTTVFDLDPTKVNLRSQSTKDITLSYAYNAANPAMSVLTEHIDDPDHSGQTFTYHIDVPSALGDVLAGNATAFVGFTASTGDNNYWNITDITSWRFAPSGPAAPRNLTAVSSAANAITLSWNNTSADETGFTVFRSTSANGTYAQIGTTAAGVTTFQDTSLAPGNYFYRVQAANGSGTSGPSNTAFMSVGVNRVSVAHADFANHADLQANGSASFPGSGQNGVGIFTAQQDIGTAGDPSQAGSGTYAAGTATYTLKASGSDIWNNADHFHYVYRLLSGDGQIIARVTHIDNTDGWAKAGVMIRGSLDAGSPQVSMDFSFGNGSSLQWRDSQGAGSGSIDVGGGTAPIPGWERLVRSGNNFTAYWATDNNGSPGNWNLAGTHTTVLPTNVLIGLAVTAHNNGALNTSTFDHVSVSPLSAVPLQLTDGGGSEAASAFFTTKLPTTLFNTTFTFQQNPVNGAADSISFVLQNDPRGTSALGGSGGAGGYGGITKSLAIKFDLYTHNTHVSSTGLFTGGQAPDSDMTKDISLAPYGINLASGHAFKVNISYNGVSLIEAITDTVMGASFTHSYQIDLPATLAGPLAYAGFTGGTGGETAVQSVLNWTADFFAPATATATFTVAGFPSPIKSGIPGSVTVTAKTAGGAADATYRGTIHFTSNDPAAQLPADYTFTAADMGVHTFTNVVLNTAGTDSISVVDVANPLLLGAQTNITVTEAVPTTGFALAFPTTVNAGTAYTLTITAKDANGNVATNYRGTVHFGSTDTKAVLPADYAFTAADMGVHAFMATLNTPGTWRIAAIDLGNPAIAAFQDVQVFQAAPVAINYPNFNNPTNLQTNGSAQFSPNHDAVGMFKGHQDVGFPGNPSPAGSATFANSTYTLRGSGSDTWDNNDHLQYAYEMLTGDGEFIARMASFDNPDYWSKAGLMIRSDLSTGAQNAFMLETGPNQGPHDEPVFQWRTSEFGGTSDTGNHNGPIQTAPIWLRLLRQGNNFSGYWAKDQGGGQHGPWMQLGTAQTITMPATVFIGLADTAHNNGAVATAVFDNLSITGNTSAPLPATTAAITDGWTSEAGSVFTKTQVPVGNFTTSFTLSNIPVFGAADGATFTIQNDPRGAGALGASGGALGYGDGNGTTNPPAIVKSVAIEFNLYSNGSHNSTTKLLLNGQVDGNNLIDMGPSGIDLKNGHALLVTLTYDGTNLVETVKDTVNNNTFTHTYQVNIPATVGGTSAYLGFTGGTGGESAVVQILSWTGQFVAKPQAAKLAVTGPTSSPTAGTSVQITVKASDIFGATFAGYTGTVHFTSSDPQAMLPADYTFTAADNGVHTFNVTLKTAGSQTVTATDPSGPSFLTSAATVTVNPAAASVLTVSAFPSPAVAGTAQTFTVTAKDAYGNVATGYRGTVHFTSSDLQAMLPANYTFIAGDNGSHQLTATLKTAGSQSITATDTTTGTITGVQTGIMVIPNVTAMLTVAGFPSPATAGSPGLVTVSAQDAYGNATPAYRGTVRLTSSDPQAVFPTATYTFTAADNGVHAFAAELRTAGTQSITATDTTTGTIIGMQTGILVAADVAARLAVTAPSSVTAGQAFNLTVSAFDRFNNLAAGYRGTVHFTTSDPQLMNLPDYTFTASDNGVHVFVVILKTAGVQTFTATDTAQPSLTGTAIITVNAGPAVGVTFQAPAAATAGQPITLRLTVVDAFGNATSGFTGSVHFDSSDAQAALPADYTFSPSDQVVALPATLFTAGSQTITATGSNGSTSTATVLVNPAVASALLVSGFPSPSTAGVQGSFTVTAMDPYGNVATGYRGTVAFYSSDGQAALPDPYTFTAADQGVQTFNATLFTAGTQVLGASDVDTGIVGEQDGITVNPGPASVLIVAGFPSPVTAGTQGTFTVTVQDAYGNVVPDFSGIVAFYSSDPQADLPNNYNFTPADQGTHSFTATLFTAGRQTVGAIDVFNPRISGQQDVQVNPAEASVLVVAGFPSSIPAGTPHSFSVTAKDRYGNVVTSYAGTVAFYSTDDAADLPDPYTFTTADGGVHVFTATLNTPGTHRLGAYDVDTDIFGEQGGIEVTAPGPQTRGPGRDALAHSLVSALAGPAPLTSVVAAPTRVTASAGAVGLRPLDPAADATVDASQPTPALDDAGILDLVLAAWDGSLTHGQLTDDFAQVSV